jgi:N6-adenosine-specific RNA methylase IME4
VIYSTVVIDPPWRYKSPGWLGGAERHYETLPYEALAALPIDTVAADDAHLWLWTTDTHMEQAFDLIDEWGFERRAIFPWIKLTTKELSWEQAKDWALIGQHALSHNGKFHKLSYGNGFYGRANPEFLILATRGKNIINDEGRHVRRLIIAEQAKHSEKPDEAYKVIWDMSPGPRIDLFGRGQRSGFDVWGREAENGIHHGNLAVWSTWAELRFQRKPEQENITSQLTITGEASGNEELGR